MKNNKITLEISWFKQVKDAWTPKLIICAKHRKWKFLSKEKDLFIDQTDNNWINVLLFDALSNVTPINYNKININNLNL